MSPTRSCPPDPPRHPVRRTARLRWSAPTLEPLLRRAEVVAVAGLMRRWRRNGKTGGRACGQLVPAAIVQNALLIVRASRPASVEVKRRILTSSSSLDPNTSLARAHNAWAMPAPIRLPSERSSNPLAQSWARLKRVRGLRDLHAWSLRSFPLGDLPLRIRPVSAARLLWRDYG